MQTTLYILFPKPQNISSDALSEFIEDGVYFVEDADDPNPHCAFVASHEMGWCECLITPHGLTSAVTITRSRSDFPALPPMPDGRSLAELWIYRFSPDDFGERVDDAFDCFDALAAFFMRSHGGYVYVENEGFYDARLQPVA